MLYFANCIAFRSILSLFFFLVRLKDCTAKTFLPLAFSQVAPGFTDSVCGSIHGGGGVGGGCFTELGGVIAVLGLL